MSTPSWLKSRSILRVAGSDTVKFLQGLITVNVQRFCAKHEDPPARSLYAAFLNRKGRIEHAAMLIPGDAPRSEGCPEEIFLDCYRESTQPLLKHLIKHRLRAKVDIDDVSADFAVAALAPDAEIEDERFMADPRLPLLHRRAIIPAEEAMRAPEGDDEYELNRLLLGVPDAEDFNGNPLPLNLALHMLNVVHFDKGCYLGQELTARTHFTGVLRKRITPVAVGVDADTLQAALEESEIPKAIVSSTQVLAPGTELFVTQRGKTKTAGVVTTAKRNCGMAVLKLEQAFDSNSRVGVTLSTEDGLQVTPWKPHWWVDEQEQNSTDNVV